MNSITLNSLKDQCVRFRGIYVQNMAEIECSIRSHGFY